MKIVKPKRRIKLGVRAAIKSPRIFVMSKYAPPPPEWAGFNLGEQSSSLFLSLVSINEGGFDPSYWLYQLTQLIGFAIGPNGYLSSVEQRILHDDIEYSFFGCSSTELITTATPVYRVVDRTVQSHFHLTISVPLLKPGTTVVMGVPAIQEWLQTFKFKDSKVRLHHKHTISDLRHEFDKLRFFNDVTLERSKTQI